MQVDGTSGIALETGVEQPLRVLQLRTLGEGQLDDALVGLACADHSIVRPDGHAWVGGLSPFPLLDDFGVGSLDEFAHFRERLTPPIAQLLDFRIDELRGRLRACGVAGLLHLVPFLVDSSLYLVDRNSNFLNSAHPRRRLVAWCRASRPIGPRARGGAARAPCG